MMIAAETHEAVAQTAGWFLQNAWIIPIIPAIGFALIILLGKRMPMKGSEFGLVTMGAALVLSIGTAWQWIQRVDEAAGHAGERAGFSRAFFGMGRSIQAAAEGGHEATFVEPVVRAWTWWQNGGVSLNYGQHIDGLSVMLLFLVAFISFLVQIFSLEYVRGDRRYTHFFAALTLFSAGMLVMVLAENMVQLILGWEIMGLCSFMLIGHWWEEGPNNRAALKAFFTVRVGDVGLLVGTSILFFGANAWTQEHLGVSGFSIRGISAWALSGEASHTVLLWAAVALFIACIGKSGQFPLHTWLPDAMAGPTPVSSLLHSSTMVVAGVFLVARVYPVFWEGMSIPSANPNMIVVIAAITIVISGLLAFVQNDIKKVLAYSTVGQLGYMMLGLGAGAWMPAVFHIFTHAFFKCCLFLCAGSVSHSGSHHSFDMKQDMGGLAKKMPITAGAWIVSSLALVGMFPFAGFFSKDEIIDNVGHAGYSTFMWIALIGAALTAAYTVRATYLTFFGEPRGAAAGVHHDDHADAHAGDHGHADAHADDHGAAHAAVAHADHGHDAHGPHESPKLLLVPIVILAVLAVLSGWTNPAFMSSEWHRFAKYVEPAAGEFFPPVSHASFHWWPNAMTSLIIVAVSLVVAWIVCVALYTKRSKALVGLTERVAPLRWGYNFLANKYYLDALYEGQILKAVTGPLARSANWINQHVIDAIVNGVGVAGAKVGLWAYNNVDQRVVDGAVNGSGVIAEGTGEALRPIQSGKVNQYGALLFAAAAVGAIVLVIINV